MKDSRNLLRRSSVAWVPVCLDGSGKGFDLKVRMQEADSLGTNVSHGVIGGIVRVRQNCIDGQEIAST